MNTHRKPNEKRMSEMEQQFYHELWKKRKAIKDLKIRNLLKTNMELLKSLDIRNAVLF